jgi:hypothetical protein
LGNSVALGILTVLTLRFYHYTAIKNALLLVMVLGVCAYSAYFLFDLYGKQLKRAESRKQINS